MLKSDFTNYKNAFEKAHANIMRLEDNEFFDTETLETICGNMRSEVNGHFIQILNEGFKTDFVGTDAFYKIFGSLHEIDYDTLYIGNRTYKVLSKVIPVLKLQ